MSRGPGHVERRIIEILGSDTRELGSRTAEIAEDVYGVRARWVAGLIGGPELSDAQIGSVRRALRRLETRGLVVREKQVDFLHVPELRWKKLVRRRGSSQRRPSGDPCGDRSASGFRRFSTDERAEFNTRAAHGRANIGPRPPDTLAGKFAKVLGMLGSEHDGERANAALAAEKLRRQSGLSWAEIVRETLERKRAVRQRATARKPGARRKRDDAAAGASRSISPQGGERGHE